MRIVTLRLTQLVSVGRRVYRCDKIVIPSEQREPRGGSGLQSWASRAFLHTCVSRLRPGRFAGFFALLPPATLLFITVLPVPLAPAGAARSIAVWM
jgi:hypothetical protein